MAEIALTTTFVPPSSCFDNTYTALGAGWYEKDVSIASAECYPSGFQSIFSQEIPYSPGVCPSGYSYEDVTSYGKDATAALCCPLGMTAYGDSGLGCSSVVDEPTALYVGGSTITVDQANLAAHGVYVAWGPSDQPASSSAVASSSNNPAPVAHSTAQPSSTAARRSISTAPESTSSSSPSDSSSRARRPQSSAITAATVSAPRNLQSSKHPPSTVTVVASRAPTSSPSHRGLSTGAKAGIGAGVSIAGVAVIAVVAAWFIIARRRKRRSTQYLYNPTVYDEKIDQSAANKAHHVSELSTEGARSELSGILPWASAHSKDERAELDARGD